MTEILAMSENIDDVLEFKHNNLTPTVNYQNEFFSPTITEL